MVLLLAPLTDLVAQEAPPITRGARVRIQTRTSTGSNQIIGTLVSLEVDTDWPHLVLKRKGGSRLSIPLSSITKFEVKGKSTGRWEEVPLPLQVGFSPQDEMRVALRFEFGR